VSDADQDPWAGSDFEEDDLAGYRAARGGPSARFAANQAAIVRSLVSQVAELIGGDEAEAGRAPGGDIAGTGTAVAADPGSADLPSVDSLAAQLGLSDATGLPDDPVLARLLPDAYADDPEAAGEFRRYTELGLRSGKVAAAQTVLDTLPAAGGRVRLSESDAQAWLRALNDVRLCLGVILGVTDDFDEQAHDLPPEDPRAAYVGVYQWLAYLQESLVEALS
jgi:hypothetical protein